MAVVRALDAGRVTREAFGKGLENVMGAPILQTVEVDGCRQAELVCFIEGTRRLRNAMVSCLADAGTTAHGDSGWRDAGIESKPQVDYAAELPAFYRSSRINLNCTSIQMLTAVNQRVFDCPAAGGFLLTDDQADPEALFDAPNETVRFIEAEEARTLVKCYSSRDRERVAITRRARERILAEHTYEHRLRTMADVLKKRYGTE